MQDKTGRIEFLDWLRAVACFLVMLMMFLPAWFGVMSPRLPAPAAIIATALATYATSFVVTWALSKVPYVRRIVG